MVYDYLLSSPLGVGMCDTIQIATTLSGVLNSGDVVTNTAMVSSLTIDPDSSDNIAVDTGVTALTVHTVHNFIYFDVNFNGIRDAGEPLLPVDLIISGTQTILSGNGTYPTNTNQFVPKYGGDAVANNLLQ